MIAPRALLLLPALLFATLLLAGCDSNEPDDEIAGTYETTRFKVTINGDTVDVLDLGGYI